MAHDPNTNGSKASQQAPSGSEGKSSGTIPSPGQGLSPTCPGNLGTFTPPVALLKGNVPGLCSGKKGR